MRNDTNSPPYLFPRSFKLQPSRTASSNRQKSAAMGIDIVIKAGKDKASSSVVVSGSVQHVITNDERETFRLGDEQLKQAVGKSFGKRPNDAYLHSPTRHDLYKKYGWPQVEVVVVVESAEIVGITSKPTMLKTETFTNSSSKKATFNIEISETVQQTTSSNWSTGGTLSVGQDINYDVGFLGTGAGGTTSLSYSQSWGIGGEHSESVTVGSTTGVSVDLQPEQSVVTELSASRGTMKVRVRYRAHLIGKTAVNYDSKHHGHHFWGLDIGSVMSNADVPNCSESTEELEVGYYSNGKIELKDKPSGSLMGYHYI